MRNGIVMIQLVVTDHKIPCSFLQRDIRQSAGHCNSRTCVKRQCNRARPAYRMHSRLARCKVCCQWTAKGETHLCIRVLIGRQVGIDSSLQVLRRQTGPQQM